MASFELDKEIEKDVFRLVTSVGQRKDSESQRLFCERGLLRISYDTRPTY